MDLNDQDFISNQFNKESLIDIEKQISHLQLKPDEQDKLFKLRQESTEEIQKEKRAFNDPEEYRRRVREKEEELLSKKTPAPHLDNNPKDMETGSLWVKIRNEAQKQVRLEHEGKLQQIDDRYLQSMTAFIETVAKNQQQTKNIPEQERLKAVFERVTKRIEAQHNNENTGRER